MNSVKNSPVWSAAQLRQLKKALSEAESMIMLQSSLIEAQSNRIYELEQGLRVANTLVQRTTA